MNLLDLLRIRATEEWLHDLLFEHPRPRAQAPEVFERHQRVGEAVEFAPPLGRVL